MRSEQEYKTFHISYFLIIQHAGYNATIAFANTPEGQITNRGYTGHSLSRVVSGKHIVEFGLINIASPGFITGNGRVYDPLTAQFLSPDNYVQAPDMTQNFNRYAYAMNNPLVYTDPSGEFWHIIIGGIVGSVVGNVQGIIEANKQGMKGWDAFKHVMVKAHIGGVAGSLGAMTGGAVGGGFWGAALGGATSGGFNATATTAYNGGSMSDMLAANFWVSNIGGLSGAAGYGITSSLGLKLFDAPNHIKEPLYASINRKIRLDLEPAIDMLNSTGGMSTGGLSSMMINGNAKSERGGDPGVSAKTYYDAVDGMVFNDNTIMSKDDFYFTFEFDQDANATYKGFKNGKHHINFSIGDYEVTVANIRTTVIHEAYGHGVKGYSGRNNTHYRAYFTEIDSRYWNATTPRYKYFTVKWMWIHYLDEVGYQSMPAIYTNAYNKYINY